MKQDIAEIAGLIERLRKRAEEDRQCAENSAIVVGLLSPQLEAFSERNGGWNTYAVRMCVDHRNSLKRDREYAADLEQAAHLLAHSYTEKTA